jgi:anti-anti-sigma factor
MSLANAEQNEESDQLLGGGFMKLEVQVLDDVVILRVREARLVFPQLETFVSAVKAQLQGAPRDLILNLSEVRYLDSPAHGSLFEIYRFVTERGGTMKVVGLQPRVRAMAGLVGLTRTFEIFADEDSALGNRPRNGKLAAIRTQ